MYVCIYIYLDDYDLNDDTWIFGNWYRRYININSISKNTTIPMGIFHMEICLKCFTHPACQPNLLRRHSLSRKSCEKLCSCVFMANCRWTKKTSLPGYLKRTASLPSPEIGPIGPKLGKFMDSKKIIFFWGRFLTVSGRVVFLRFGVVNFVYHCHDVYIACTWNAYHRYSAWGPICEMNI